MTKSDTLSKARLATTRMTVRRRKESREKKKSDRCGHGSKLKGAPPAGEGDGSGEDDMGTTLRVPKQGHHPLMAVPRVRCDAKKLRVRLVMS